MKIFLKDIFFVLLEMRLMPGDELRLRYVGDPMKSTWGGVGHVLKVPNSRNLKIIDYFFLFLKLKNLI